MTAKQPAPLDVVGLYRQGKEAANYLIRELNFADMDTADGAGRGAQMAHTELLDVLDRLANAAQRGLLTQPPIEGWQPIDSAPKDGTGILAIRHNGVGYERPISVFYDEKYEDTYPWRITNWESDNAYAEKYFDYWMPLPQPPQRKDDQ